MKWVDDGAYGSNDTGEWNGMLGEIIENVSQFHLSFKICSYDLCSFIQCYTESGLGHRGPHHQLSQVRRGGLLDALHEARHRNPLQGPRQGAPHPVRLPRPFLRKPLDLNRTGLRHGVHHDVCSLKIHPDGVGHGRRMRYLRES